MGNRCPNGHLQNKKYNAILIKNGPTLCVCVLFVILLQISAFFYCLNFEKADCSIFALSVGRSVGRLASPLFFFQYIQAYKPFTNPVPLHTSTTNLYWYILRIGASIRDLHCLLGLVVSFFVHFVLAVSLSLLIWEPFVLHRVSCSFATN